MTEGWRPVPVPFYAHAYEVSSLGRVRRIDSGRVKQFCWSGHGTWLYLYTTLSWENKVHSYRVATLIAGAFIGPRPTPDIEINHKNGDRGDNRVENLEYVTKRQNADHAVALGLPPRGERHGSAKLTEAQVREIRVAAGTERDIAQRYGVSFTTVHNIRTRHTWRHVA